MSDEKKHNLPDHESDPARTPGLGWVGEGGASHLGPATHIAAGRADTEDADEALGVESDDDGQ